MTETLQVVLADSQPAFRTGIRTFLKTHSNIIVKEIDTPENLLILLKQTHPHVILLDFSLAQNQHKFDLLTQIQAMATPAEVIIMLEQGDATCALQALLNGAVGVITKDVAAAELVLIIERVAQGRRDCSARVVEALVEYLLEREATNSAGDPVAVEALTEREREVFALIARGLSNEEIAEALAVQVGTVKAHVSRILSKLQVKNRAQAALLAVGQFSPDESKPKSETD